MHIILEEADNNDQQIECHHCHWKGTAGELKKGEHFLLSNMTEIFCPRCHKYLGFIQHTSTDGDKSTD